MRLLTADFDLAVTTGFLPQIIIRTRQNYCQFDLGWVVEA